MQSPYSSIVEIRTLYLSSILMFVHCLFDLLTCILCALIAFLVYIILCLIKKNNLSLLHTCAMKPLVTDVTAHHSLISPSIWHPANSVDFDL